MGDLSEFSWKTRLFLKAYSWRKNDPVPWNPLQKPLSESRLALVSSAGFFAPGQDPFDSGLRGGDYTYREISNEVKVATLVSNHRSETYDHTGMNSDPNLAFPIDRVKELAQEGHLGSINHRHFSMMGSITAPGRMLRHTCPEIGQALVDDGVDVALLVPV